MAETPRIDWDAVTEEATQLLSDFIRIDTSNPPGREKAACDWLAAIFRREGIDDVAFYDASDGSEHGIERMSMTARLPGSGGKRPLVLLNHTDVVPVERQYWDFEPFSGAVVDGVIYGRGALDNVAMTAASARARCDPALLRALLGAEVERGKDAVLEAPLGDNRILTIHALSSHIRYPPKWQYFQAFYTPICRFIIGLLYLSGAVALTQSRTKRQE